MSTSHIFPQSVLGTITLVESAARDRGWGHWLEPKLGVSQGFRAQWLTVPYSGQDCVLSFWSRIPEGQVWAGSLLF